MASSSVIEVRGVVKSYSGQLALAGVDFEVEPGEVHALVGENGSGKSTLIKTIAGFQDPDSYDYAAIDNEPFRLGSVEDAADRGLRFIHQNLGLLPNMSSVENCAISRGFHTARGYRIRWAQERRRVYDLLLDFGVDIDPDVPVVQLRPAERTAVAIVRALQDWQHGVKLLVLDEPTASLPTPEVRRLFQVIRQITSRGIGVVYVSHRLDEVFDIADRVTVLRDGRRVGDWPITELNHTSMVSHMIGRAAELTFAAPPPVSRKVVLDVHALCSNDVSDLSFTVAAGQIVGFAGILGSGREAVAPLLAGALPSHSGYVTVGEVILTNPSPRDAICAGIALVPADRGSQGLIADFSVTENMTLADLSRLTRRTRIDAAAERHEVAEWITSLGIKTRSPNQSVATLSGGNQQKVVLAKWLRTSPKVLLLDEPAHGVDIGAKSAIYSLIAERLKDGLAVVMCSTESEDLAHLCDRVIVMSEGRIGTVLEREQISADRITREVLRTARTPTTMEICSDQRTVPIEVDLE